MKERPIIFNTEMVAAILQGRKTQTRRVVKLKSMDRADIVIESDDYFHFEAKCKHGSVFEQQKCRYGKPGDRLWVKEDFTVSDYRYPLGPIGEFINSVEYFEHANPALKTMVSWREAKFMPRWASRILLEVTNVRAERLQDISDGDAMAEGIQLVGVNYVDHSGAIRTYNHRDHFVDLWGSIYHGEKSWAANPWVWVIDFRRVES